MATINKDFKIKSGLVVEGTTATVNGNQVLTENAGDQYILDLIGGETLVKSVSNQFDVSLAGELSLDLAVVDTYYDEKGAASAAELNAKNYADGLAQNYDAAGSASTAESNANTYTNNKVLDYTKTVDLDSTIDGYGYLKSADLTGYATEAYADQAEIDAKAYADSLIDDASTTSTNSWSAYKTSTEIGLAQAAAELHADTAIANLVDSAPATLDTLNELAAALQDNPDIITDLQNIAAGKQDTLTAGNGIDLTNNTAAVRLGPNAMLTYSVDGGLIVKQASLDALYDANGAATTAENNAKGYADDLIATEITNRNTAISDAVLVETNNRFDAINALTTDDIEEGVNNQYFTTSRAETAAKNLLTSSNLTNITITDNGQGLTITAENGVADSTTDDLAEGQTNLYFENSRAIDAITNATIHPVALSINDYRKEEATQQSVANASTVTVHSFDYPYESAKYVVRVVGWVNGVKHSQITEILLTTDGNNNIAMTEYGNVHTSTDPLATFSAAWSGTYDLTATTAVAGCEIIAAATMLSWAD